MVVLQKKKFFRFSVDVFCAGRILALSYKHLLNMNRAIKTETFQPTFKNSKRLAKLTVRGQKTQTINRALDSYYGKQVPGLADVALRILNALEKDGASAADVKLCRSLCEEALGA